MISKFLLAHKAKLRSFVVLPDVSCRSMVGEYRSPHLWSPIRRRIELVVGNARLLL